MKEAKLKANTNNMDSEAGFKPEHLSYKEALARAESDTTGWEEAQYKVLQDHIRASLEELKDGDPLKGAAVNDINQMSKGFDLDGLKRLAIVYKLLQGFSLKRAALKYYGGGKGWTLNSKVKSKSEHE